MRTILFILVSLIGFNPYAKAATPSIQVENNPAPQPEAKQQEEEARPKYIEDTLVYYRASLQTVGRFPNPDSTSMYSFGIRRLPSNFFYGLDYSVYTSADGNYRVDSLQGSLGYRIIWDNRFLPYGIIQFGSANFKDKSQTLSDSTGIAETIDIGIDFLKVYKYFKFSAGFRHMNINFNSKDFPNASFTDLYTIIGFEF